MRHWPDPWRWLSVWTWRRWLRVKRGSACPVCFYEGPTACPDWWEQCPCGCDIPMSDDRYYEAHGGR